MPTSKASGSSSSSTNSNRATVTLNQPSLATSNVGASSSATTSNAPNSRIAQTTCPTPAATPNLWSLEFTQLDVGQGDAAIGAFINKTTPTESKYFMIDGGAKFAKESNVAFFEQQYPGKKLDVVFMGSTDADHSNGLPLQTDKKQFKITDSNTKFRTYESAPKVLEEASKKKKEKGKKRNVQAIAKLSDGYEPINVGDSIWDILGVPKPTEAPNLTIVAADGTTQSKANSTPVPTRTPKDVNDHSLGFLLEYKHFNMYTGGDLGAKKEQEIIENYKGKEIDVWKIGHHGSKFSTTEDVLKKANPQAVIISHGARDGYDHPAEQTLDTIHSSKVPNCYLTNSAEARRGQNYLTDYPKITVAGHQSIIFTSQGPNKPVKGHLTITVDAEQAERGTFKISYNVPSSTPNRRKTVTDNFQATSLDEKLEHVFGWNQNLFREIKKQWHSASPAPQLLNTQGVVKCMGYMSDCDNAVKIRANSAQITVNPQKAQYTIELLNKAKEPIYQKEYKTNTARLASDGEPRVISRTTKHKEPGVAL